MQEITIKYHSGYRKHKYELAHEPKKQPNRIFIDDNLLIKLIKDCKTTSAHKFRTKLKLEFISDNTIKSKAIKYAAKNYCLIMSKVV